MSGICIYLIMISVLVPFVDHDLIRVVFGYFRAGVSIAGALILFQMGRFWKESDHRLAKRQKTLCYTTAIVLLVNFAFGVAGIVQADRIIWLYIWVGAPLAVLYEVIAYLRVKRYLDRQK